MSRSVTARVLAAALAVGCEVGTAEGDAPMATPGRITVLAEVEGARICDGSPEVIEIQLRATRVGCDPGPPAPCTLPADPAPVLGDRATCPITDPSILLGVEVEVAGRYEIELVARSTTGESSTECFEEAGGEVEVVVSEAALEAGGTLRVEATGEPCP